MIDYTNKLAQENSPYLLQHAHNPVEWYPWGEEAFEKARNENKPLFLSVGYSTCHWCHVMAHESFENTEVAELLNRYFVSVKVDREERPDVDRVYMTFIQATTGGGGWPMSVWLTPDLTPFFGGTYYPPEDRRGFPGFKGVLRQIAEAWKKDAADITASSAELLERLRQATAPQAKKSVPGNQALCERAYTQIKASFDPVHGGFGEAPKFPRPATFVFLLSYYAHTGTEAALEMVLFTLRKMASGGIHDHLGGGFHRYSVDRRWHVPHFEKMLYDQAQLVNVYLDAYQITRDSFFAKVSRDILGYVLHDMTGEQGQFYSAQDADSETPHCPGEHAEGAYYVWEYDEIVSVLGQRKAAVVNARYGVEENGNVRHDPQGEFHGKNILFVSRSVDELAKQFGESEDTIEAILLESRELLLAQRAVRPRVHLDDKTIAAWNGLMISAFARAFQVLGQEEYLVAATAASAFVRKHLYLPAKGVLIRCYRNRQSPLEGYADDYAFLIQGLLDLYEASFDVEHLQWAIELQNKQDDLFLDHRDGGYFSTTGEDLSILMRIKEEYDGAEPSANSVSLQNLSRLALMTGRPEYRERAERIMAAFRPRLEHAPHIMPLMISAYDFHLATGHPMIIAGYPDAQDTKNLLRTVRERFIPSKTVMLADGEAGQRRLEALNPFIASLHPVDGKATAYVCENGACTLPVTDPEALRSALEEVQRRNIKSQKENPNDLI